MKLKNHKVKGFTLVEMVTVVAIIGALLGVFAPAMSNYYWKSRVKAANADAKMIYNAAQTEVQKYIAYDRANPDSPSSLKDGYFRISYSPGTGAGTTKVYAVDSSTLKTSGEVDTTTASGAVLADAASTVTRAVNQKVSEANLKYWTVYVNNYIVKACISADINTTAFVGQYSAGKILIPDDRPTTTYDEWLDCTDATDSIAVLANKYESAS